MTKLILWDWDNTLVDTSAAVLKSQNELRESYNLPILEKPLMNQSLRNIFKELFATPELAEEARLRYLSFYEKNSHAINPFPDAENILKTTQQFGFINVLASNKTGPILRNEVAALNLDKYFSRIIGSFDAMEDKPSTTFTDAAVHGFNWAKIFSVGDGTADILMARNFENGTAILIGSNPNTPEFLQTKPDFYFENLTTFLSALEPTLGL